MQDQNQIPALLCCDCGNSSIKIATVIADKVSEVRSFELTQTEQLQNAISHLWSELPEPKKTIAASVNKAALQTLTSAAQNAIGKTPLVVGQDLPNPIDTDIKHPESVGKDRLCACAAAFDQLGVPCVVADFGTAITIDCVDESGVFKGGVILPGLQTSAKALANLTDQLPLVDVKDCDFTFGQSTEQAIQAGILFAARGALRERVEAYATELGNWPLVILTGGDAKTICPDVSEDGIVQAVVPELTLRGIAMSYYRSLLNN